jgi:ethanolamine ammonia-lyase small subunit
VLIEDSWTKLRELTGARIALGRAGHAMPTGELLAFQLAHAKARDAVYRPLDLTRFNALQPVLLKSSAPDRATYLRRPDLGRTLDRQSAVHLVKGDWDAVMVIADGLSAAAVEEYATPMIAELRLNLAGWRLAPMYVVQQGRVAIADEIGGRVGAHLSLILIGERPGLSSAESMGIYLTWNPRAGRTDAERNCISNIRAGGLAVDAAARRAARLMLAARAQRITGVDLRLKRLDLPVSTQEPPCL